MKLLRGKACQSALQRGNGKRLTVMGEVLMDGFSDRGSIPLISTKGANPNSLFFVKHCFGFVVHIEEVG